MLCHTTLFPAIPRFIIAVRELYDRNLRGRWQGIDTGFGVSSQFISSENVAVSAIEFADVAPEQGQVKWITRRRFDSACWEMVHVRFECGLFLYRHCGQGRVVTLNADRIFILPMQTPRLLSLLSCTKCTETESSELVCLRGSVLWCKTFAQEDTWLL